MARIALLHAGTPAYTGATLREQPLRGVQSGAILLAESLVARGHEATIYNPIESETEHLGVRYRPFAEAREAEGADLLIANNNAMDLDAAPGGGVRVVWLRNPTTYWRLWKKGNLGPILRHRPHAVLLSRTHDSDVPSGLPFRSRRVIGLGTDPSFLGAAPAAAPRPPRAVFYASFYRGLDWVLEVWRRHIHPAAPSAELHLFGDLKGRPSADFAAHGIIAHPPAPKAEIAAFLRGARALLYQGHRDETFCNIVSEAFASGAPVVTAGIGVLGERVTDGVSGLIGAGEEAFGAAAVRALTDDALWMTLHAGAMADPSVKPWPDRAAEWERAFLA